MTLDTMRNSAWDATKKAFSDLTGVLKAIKYVSPWRLLNGFAAGDQEKRSSQHFPFYDQLNDRIASYGMTTGGTQSSVQPIGLFGYICRQSMKGIINLLALVIKSIAFVAYIAWQLLKGAVLLVATGVVAGVEG